MKDNGFDWPGLMRLGLRGLGLQPGEFWALTPAELRIMLGRESGSPPLGRARLEELAQAFPDNRREARRDQQQGEVNG